MGGGAIRAGIGPLALQGLNEAFGLAVGAWGVRPGPRVADAEDATGLAKGAGDIPAAVVIHDAVNADAVLSKPRDRAPEKVCRGLPALPREDFDEGERTG